jgi:uncharacterized protein YbjQ (UPF0145 family)
MRIRLSPLPLLIAAVAVLGSGCATAPPADRPPVQVFPMNPYVGQSYDVVGRMWAGTSKTAYRVPVYSTREEAVASMQNEAAQLNADALISVSCLDGARSTWFQTNEPGFLCYGVAIKLQRAQG